MDPDKSKEICALADVVRQSLELSVPVDVVEAIARLGGSLREVESAPGQPEATIRRTGERFEITIKRNHVPTRQRFSLAHELGHLFLHMGYLVDPKAWGRRVIPGIIFVGYIRDPDQVMQKFSREKHREILWFNPNDPPPGQHQCVPNFERTIQAAAEVWRRHGSGWQKQ